jgi:FMN phosphatase YigB (HAD superfamily)
MIECHCEPSRAKAGTVKQSPGHGGNLLFSKNHFKAILFDLDGTLRHHLPSGGEVFVKYLRSLGVKFSVDDELRAVRWEHQYFANSPEIQEDHEAFKDDHGAFWVNFAKRRMVAMGIPESRAVELAPGVSAHMEQDYKPEVVVPEEIPPILASLKDSGYVLGVISNRGEPYHDELKALHLDAYFHFSLAGGEVNSFKPEPRIFERGLELAGASAGEAMYIGDNYFADIVGSRRAGLTPVLYDPINVFPDAECAVIKSFDELHDLLKRRSSSQ